MKSKIKRNVKGLPTSKLWLSLQSERCLQRGVYSRHQRLFPPRERLQQKHRLSSLAAPSRPISLIAEDFRQQSRGSQPYGKNQFCIRFRKTGTDHTLTVSPAMIRGEPILSISALKVPLCRQRFLRTCPLYLSPTGRMEKKEVKENQMISAHGIKILIGTLGICLIIVTYLFGQMMLERRAKIKLYEKNYSEALSSLETKNRELQRELQLQVKQEGAK